jgi:23S rRNA pseudouridine1911/1915/1917 synthase
VTASRQRFTVEDADAGLRLDQVIPRHVAGLSRRKARAVIDLGGVFVDRARVKVAGRVVRAGQVVEVVVGGVFERSQRALERSSASAGAAGERADEPPLVPAIVYADDDVVVVDKPAGLVTAPTPESDRGDLLDQLRARYGEVYLVHRIDRPTSGLLVFARTAIANKQLGEAFKTHDVEREYRAVAIGDVRAQTIDRPIGGRRAVTHVEPIERFADTSAPDGRIAATLVRARLETGRTHQIRLHLAGLGHPVAGDRMHGGERERTFEPRPPRLVLHAAVLGFAHPVGGRRLRFESELPPDLARWIDRLRGLE